MYLSDIQSFTPLDNADSASDTGSQSEPRSLRHAQVATSAVKLINALINALTH